MDKNLDKLCSILFVDPSVRWLGFAQRTLQRRGIRSEIATSIGDAWYSPRHTAGPQLAFVSLELADSEPDQLRRFAKATGRYVVVLFPQRLMPHTMSRVFRLGAYDCAGKPQDVQSLLRLVGSFVEDVCPSARDVVSCLAPNGVPVI